MSLVTGYLAPAGFVAELRHELKEVVEEHGRLLLAPGPPRRVAWVQNLWLAPQRLPLRSIAAGARSLRALQRGWALYSWRHHRRAHLIQEQLPHVSARPIPFGTPPPAAPLGSWTLLDRDTILAATRCSSPFPHGEVRFQENRTGPPSRAYLKLWELFTILQSRPDPGERCLDLGASPGGWTWALAELGARVLAVDRAPLDAAVAQRAGVEVRRHNAFTLEPRAVGPVDWLFCDVVCYPARLLGLVERWLASGLARHLVCTIKFQGATDHATTARLAALEGSSLLHLSHNRHELTWVWGPGLALTRTAAGPEAREPRPH